MLSAFQAEPIVELKQRDKSKIESILAHGDQLFVGLSTGSLRIYRVNDIGSASDESSRENGNNEKKTELMREYEKFAKYKIEYLAVFREANILISLSGGLISIHDLGSFDLQDQLHKTKGASLFAATSNVVNDGTTGIPSLVSRLAVAVKRRILLWLWQDGELATEVQEIALPSGIKSLTWATGTTIIAGLQSNYVLVDVESEAIQGLQGPGSIGGGADQDSGRLGGIGTGTMSYIGMGGMVPPPLATGLGKVEMLLARDINSLFIDRKGTSIERRQVPWKIAPHAVAYSYPFMLSLHETAKGYLEVRNPETLTVLQTIDLPGAALLQVPNPNISLPHQGKGFLVASDRVIWRMKGLKYDAQIDTLIEQGDLDEAISLVSMIEETLIEDKTKRLREAKMLKAQRFFDSKQYRDSLDLFGEVLAPPDRVIRLFPEQIAGNVASDRAASGESPKGHKKTASVASTKRSKTTDSASIRSSNAGSNEMPEKELKTAVRELQAFLADIRRRLQRFFNPDQTVKNLEEISSDTPSGDVFRVIDHILSLTDPSQAEFEKKLLEVASMVDTTLFRAHMFATPSLAGSLFRINNFCDPEVVMNKLEEAGRYGDLIEFLYGKRLHREALQRLRKFGKANESEGIDPELHGPERTVSYLQNLSAEYLDVILEFVRWPLEVKPALGLQVFIADTANAEALDREPVFEFLTAINDQLAFSYLEHIVDELNDSTPEFHQRLVEMYLDRSRRVTGPEQDELLAKLHSMLTESTQYSPAKVLGLLPREDSTFYQATAIVFSKMGQHKQALQIYIFKLHDLEKAEAYCNQVHVDETARLSKTRRVRKAPSTTDPLDEEPSIYHILLNLYLNPPSGENAMIGPAIDLMAKHGPRLPASSTLEMIPQDLLVKELEFYFRGQIRNASTARNDARIVASLRKVDSIRLQAALILGDENTGIQANGGKQRKVRIDDERICGVCYKRLGGSVISVFPEYVSRSALKYNVGTDFEQQLGRPPWMCIT